MLLQCFVLWDIHTFDSGPDFFLQMFSCCHVFLDPHGETKFQGQTASRALYWALCFIYLGEIYIVFCSPTLSLIVESVYNVLPPSSVQPLCNHCVISHPGIQAA